MTLEVNARTYRVLTILGCVCAIQAYSSRLSRCTLDLLFIGCLDSRLASHVSRSSSVRISCYVSRIHERRLSAFVTPISNTDILAASLCISIVLPVGALICFQGGGAIHVCAEARWTTGACYVRQDHSADKEALLGPGRALY